MGSATIEPTRPPKRPSSCPRLIMTRLPKLCVNNVRAPDSFAEGLGGCEETRNGVVVKDLVREREHLRSKLGVSGSLTASYLTSASGVGNSLVGLAIE